MKCPRCGQEIPFYNLKPNCRSCGVNIMYYEQDAGLVRDAKRTELEAAAARMVIARVKAAFIGSRLAVGRMIAVVLSVTSLLVPIGGVRYPCADLHGLCPAWGNRHDLPGDDSGDTQRGLSRWIGSASSALRQSATPAKKNKRFQMAEGGSPQ